ncbi:MAG: FGGY family carbohydrate kinase, partial [Hypericibacter sp.]
MASHILAIDQGTTSSRAILFDSHQHVVAVAQEEFQQHFPRSGWVEHEPEDIWNSTLAVCQAAIAKAGLGPRDIAGIGITNQRETTVVWDRASGRAIHRAIVWQDRRTAEICAGLRDAGHEPMVSAKTGLILDPYFSGTKIAWILDHVSGARDLAAKGRLAFGTVDAMETNSTLGLDQAIGDFAKAAPKVLLDIDIAAPQALVQGLLSGRYQVVLVPAQPRAQT